jgi:hypothetical protein
MFYTICSYINHYITKKTNGELIEITRMEKIALLEPILSNFKVQEILGFPMSYEDIISKLEMEIEFVSNKEKKDLMNMLITAYKKVVYIDRQIENIGLQRQQSTQRKYICLTYFKRSKCKYGHNCKYPHISDEKEAKKYFCNNGSRCYYPGCIFKHETLEERDVRRDQEEHDDCETKCNICFTDVLQTNKRFGLLSHCNHVFCLNCIKTYRMDTTIEITNRLKCPYCRIKSTWLLPSNFYLSGYKKQQALEEFHDKRKKIKCRHGEQCNRIHTCPFKH